MPLVRNAQAIQHPHDAAHQRGQRDGIIDPRADIHDARFERREAPARAQVPPDLGRILEQSRIDHDVHVPLIFGIALELFRKSGTWQCVENGQPITFEPRVTTLPKGRGTGECQQVRQEVAHLVHQVDAQRIVIDADVHVHAADEQAPGSTLHFGRERIVAVFAGVFLLGPATERVR
jgi:hypothetical protein